MLRRFAACAMALMLLTGVARASSALCVKAPGVVALTDAGGRELIGNGLFEDIFTVREGELFAAGRRGAYRLYDASGAALGEIEFSMIDDEGDALVYRSGARYGAMDASGEGLLAPEWTQLAAGEGGEWLALDGDPLDERPDEIIHIDASGAVRRTGVYTASGLDRVRCGRMRYMNADGRWGAVNASGDVVIDPGWAYIGAFEDGVAKVAGPEGIGLIDVNGRTVIAPTYRWLERSKSLVAACDDGIVDLYGPRGGQRRARLPGAFGEVALAGNRVCVARDGAVRLYDAWGALLAESDAGTTYAQGSRGQLIAIDGEWGEACQRLVGRDGSVASAGFQQLLPLCGGRYAFLEMDGMEYYSQALGRLQRSWNYADRRYGLMDGSGRILLPAKYLEIRALNEDRLLLVGDGEVLLADRNGVALRRWVTAEGEGPSGEADG